MRRCHPNWRQAALVAGALVLIGTGGCRSQTAPLANPFLAPDRVPPPATRTLAPGTAQPYYPGDPLPVMQSGITPPTAAPAAATTAPAPPNSNFGPPTIRADGNLATASDGPVAIPSDGDRLRFELPPPSPTQTAAAAPPTPVAPPAFRPPVQVASAPTPRPVQPALYSSQPAPVPSYATDPAYSAQQGPWRSPQVAPPISPTPISPMQVSPTLQPQVPTAPGQPGTSVRLRAVPSSPPEVSPPPRIRLPGYTTSSRQPVVAPGALQPAAYVAPLPGQVVQTVRITELPAFGPPVPSVAGSGTPSGPPLSVASQPPLTASVSQDGFRPRGSTR